jgi:flavin reductase
MVTRDEYRAGMARLGAAVNVITSDGAAGRNGFTASAVCSVTDDPAILLVCVNMASRQNDLLKANGVLCVNTLNAEQTEVATLFSTRDLTMDERFAAAQWSTLATGAPVLEGAIAAFDCRIVERMEQGTHAVLFCQVEAVRLGEARHALMYFGRAFHRIETVA